MYKRLTSQCSCLVFDGRPAAIDHRPVRTVAFADDLPCAIAAGEQVRLK